MSHNSQTTRPHESGTLHQENDDGYKPGSISLSGAVAMGTGVMIGAGIFALTGQIAELAGPLFPLSFIIGGTVTAFSAYSYIKMSNAFPSSGGIAMILQKAYGPGVIAATASLLMVFSMIVSESLVARTFATYTLSPFGLESNSLIVPLLGVGIIIFAYLINVSGNRSVGLFSLIMSGLKISGIALFGIAALWAAGLGGSALAAPVSNVVPLSFVASVALSILAFKGFTTITNSGSEIVDPHRNVGRAIVIAIVICAVTYLLVAFAVGSSLNLEQIVEAKNYSLAAAAEPMFGNYGFYFIVLLAIVATSSGVTASVFAVSRMLTMLTSMKMIPHSHFGMSGSIRKHMLLYTVIIAGTLTILFDLGRIASLGAFFYLVMDMLVHWGVFRYMRKEVNAKSWILISALSLDALVLAAFTTIKLKSDPMIVLYATIGIVLVFIYERLYLSSWSKS